MSLTSPQSLVVGDPVADKIVDILLCDEVNALLVRTCFRHHVCLGDLPKLGVVDPNHGHVRHTRMGTDQVLKLGWGNLNKTQTTLQT